MPSLMGIADELRRLIREEGVDEETGEVIDNSREIAKLNYSMEEKVDAYMEWLEELQAELNARADKIERLEVMQEQTEKQIAKVKNTLIDMMALLGVKKFNTLTNHISYSTKEKLEIDNEALIPIEFKREKVVITHSVDKEKAKKFIKEGGFVEGCHIISNPSLRINESKKKTKFDK